MKKKLFSIILTLALVVTFMPFQTLTVDAAKKVKTKATVSTQKGLKKALKNKKLKTLTIKTSQNRSFSIPKGNRKNLNINLNASIGKLSVSKDARINEIRIYKAGSWNFNINGRVSKLSVKAKSKVTLSGSPAKKVAVAVSSKSAGGSVTNNANSSIDIIHNNEVYSLSTGKSVSVLENGHLMMVEIDKPVQPIGPEPVEPDPEEPDVPDTPDIPDVPDTPEPPKKDPSFKAVYDTNNEANVLTFYYDTVDYSGNNIHVYDNLPLDSRPENFKDFENVTEEEFWGYATVAPEIKKVVIDSSVANLHGLKSCYMMFDSMYNCSSISGAEYLDVSQVVDMRWMFASFGSSVENMTSVPDVSNWNTSSLETTDHMFYAYGVSSTELVKVPDVSKWDMSNATLVQDMFNDYGAQSKKLEFKLDLSKWNIPNLVYTAYMFYDAGYSASAENWQVIIPSKTQEKENTPEYWYLYKDYAVYPAEGRSFTLAQEPSEEPVVNE